MDPKQSSTDAHGGVDTSQDADFESAVETQPELSEQSAESSAPAESETQPKAEGDTEKQASADADKSDDNEADGDDQASERDEKPRTGRSVRRQINKLTRRAKSAEERAQQAEQKYAELEKKLQQYEPAEAQKPKRDDFESEEDFIDAMVDWKMQKAQPSQPENNNAPELTPEEAELQAAMTDVMSDGVELYDDFEAEIFDPKKVMPQAAVMAAAESEYAPDILYYLAKNQDVAKRIASMQSMSEVARAIGRIEAQLSQSGGVQAPSSSSDEGEGQEPPPKQNKKSTSAPDPIDPLNTDGETSQTPLEDSEMDDFMRRRNKQELEKRGSIY